MIKINLIPVELIEKERKLKAIKVIVSSALLFFIILFLLTLWRMYVLANVSSKLKYYEVELMKIQKLAEEVKNYDAKKLQVEENINMITSLTKSGLLYPSFMEDFLKILPEGIRIESLEVTNSPEEGLSISGNFIAMSNYEIASLVSNLESSEIFKNPQIVSPLTDRDIKGKTGKGFRMSFLYIKK